MDKHEYEQARKEWTGEAQREAQPAIQATAIKGFYQGRNQMPARTFGKRKAS